MLNDRVKSTLAEYRRSFSHDFMASIVVFLVALPLCMGVAIASGVPVAAGLISGIVGGLVVGALAGAPLQVSGPAAGLTVIVWKLVDEYGLEALGITVLLAGLLQLLSGCLRLGQWFRAVSPAVVQGMLAGIGVLIFASQFHVMVDDHPRGDGITNLLTIPEALYKGIVPLDGSAHHWAARLGLLTILVILFWKPLVPKQLKFIPGPLVAVIVATLAANLVLPALFSVPYPDEAQLTSRFQEPPVPTADDGTTDPEEMLTVAEIEPGLTEAQIEAGLRPLPIKYVHLPENLADAIQMPSWETWQTLQREDRTVTLADGSEKTYAKMTLVGLLIAALTFAMIASAETLLCVTALDRMHQGPRAKYDKELFAQGAGNTICGLLGALPVTGVIVRSTANIEAGARTRNSAILHGLWLLLCVVAVPGMLQLVPTAALAAILVYTGWKLMNPKAVIALWEYGKSEVAIYGATVFTIVAKDLLVGVLLGIALSAVKLLYTFSHLRIDIEQQPERNRIIMRLEGAATFLRLPKLAAALEQIPPGTELHVKFDNIDYIDHACLDLLMGWRQQHEEDGGVLEIDWGALHAKFLQPTIGGNNNGGGNSGAGDSSARQREPTPTSN